MEDHGPVEKLGEGLLKLRITEVLNSTSAPRKNLQLENTSPEAAAHIRWGKPEFLKGQFETYLSQNLSWEEFSKCMDEMHFRIANNDIQETIVMFQAENDDRFNRLKYHMANQKSSVTRNIHMKTFSLAISPEFATMLVKYQIFDAGSVKEKAYLEDKSVMLPTGHLYYISLQNFDQPSELVWKPTNSCSISALQTASHFRNLFVFADAGVLKAIKIPDFGPDSVQILGDFSGMKLSHLCCNVRGDFAFTLDASRVMTFSLREDPKSKLGFSASKFTDVTPAKVPQLNEIFSISMDLKQIMIGGACGYASFLFLDQNLSNQAASVWKEEFSQTFFEPTTASNGSKIDNNSKESIFLSLIDHRRMAVFSPHNSCWFDRTAQPTSLYMPNSGTVVSIALFGEVAVVLMTSGDFYLGRFADAPLAVFTRYKETEDDQLQYGLQRVAIGPNEVFVLFTEGKLTRIYCGPEK